MGSVNAPRVVHVNSLNTEAGLADPVTINSTTYLQLYDLPSTLHGDIISGVISLFITSNSSTADVDFEVFSLWDVGGSTYSNKICEFTYDISDSPPQLIALTIPTDYPASNGPVSLFPCNGNKGLRIKISGMDNDIEVAFRGAFLVV